MVAFLQCGSRYPTEVFSHYEYGDPLPHWARFVGEDGTVERGEAIAVYVRCEREAGHSGKHLARKTNGWIASTTDDLGSSPDSDFEGKP